MNYIKFRENYNNKLDKDLFTTIRPYEFDRYKLGYVYDIKLEDETLFKAAIMRIDPVVDLSKVPNSIIRNNSGCKNVEEFIELLKSFYGDLSNKKWVILTLSKISENGE